MMAGAVGNGYEAFEAAADHLGNAWRGMTDVAGDAAGVVREGFDHGMQWLSDGRRKAGDGMRRVADRAGEVVSGLNPL